MDDLDDAIIEDTVHCDLCGASWVLGGNADGICVTLPMLELQREFPVGRRGAQLKLCVACAAFVATTLEAELSCRDVCEHGVLCGDWCEPCNRAYLKAREEN